MRLHLWCSHFSFRTIKVLPLMLKVYPLSQREYENIAAFLNVWLFTYHSNHSQLSTSVWPCEPFTTAKWLSSVSNQLFQTLRVIHKLHSPKSEVLGNLVSYYWQGLCILFIFIIKNRIWTYNFQLNRLMLYQLSYLCELAFHRQVPCQSLHIFLRYRIWHSTYVSVYQTYCVILHDYLDIVIIPFHHLYWIFALILMVLELIFYNLSNQDSIRLDLYWSLCPHKVWCHQSATSYSRTQVHEPIHLTYSLVLHLHEDFSW